MINKLLRVDKILLTILSLAVVKLSDTAYSSWFRDMESINDACTRVDYLRYITLERVPSLPPCVNVG